MNAKCVHRMIGGHGPISDGRNVYGQKKQADLKISTALTTDEQTTLRKEVYGHSLGVCTSVCISMKVCTNAYTYGRTDVVWPAL